MLQYQIPASPGRYGLGCPRTQTHWLPPASHRDSPEVLQAMPMVGSEATVEQTAGALPPVAEPPALMPPVAWPPVDTPPLLVPPVGPWVPPVFAVPPVGLVLPPVAVPPDALELPPIRLSVPPVGLLVPPLSDAVPPEALAPPLSEVVPPLSDVVPAVWDVLPPQATRTAARGHANRRLNDPHAGMPSSKPPRRARGNSSTATAWNAQRNAPAAP